MRAYVTAAILCMLASGIWAADEGTGNSLIKQCHAAVAAANGERAYEVGDAMYCFGMVGGIYDSMTMWAPVHGIKICQPQSGVTRGQIARIVFKYLDDHPKDLGKEDGALAMVALFDAFHCPPDRAP